MSSPLRTRLAVALPWNQLGYLLAVAIGLAATFDVFPLRDLLGRLPPGLPPLGPDGLQHIAGQLYFLAEPWHWPLLIVHRLDPPHGINIGLTDSIPLAAVLLKLLHPLVPWVRQGVGPWLGVAWVLQPVCAVFALRGTGERGPVAALAVAAMASAMPTFILRTGHEALDGHFILLLALGLYLRATRARAGGGAVVALALLVPLTLFVHPYLMAMVAATALAAPSTLAARAASSHNRDEWRCALLVGLPVLAGLVATGWLAILFGYAGGGVPGDYGVYSMNLAAPLRPVFSRLVPGVDIHAGDATGGQSFEGYQYLGAGLLLLLLAVLLRARGRGWVGRALRRHVGLAAACVVLSAYAVSTHAYLLHHSLMHLRFVPPGGRVLRASGRLFWPVAYVLLIAGVRGTSVAWPKLRAALLLTAATLQLFDASTLVAAVRDQRFLAGQSEDASSAALDDILAQVRSVALVPRIECDAGAMPTAMQVIYLAARRDLPVNTMYAARLEPVNRCDPVREAAAADHLAPGALGVAYGASRAAQARLWRAHGLHCADLDALTLCSADGATLASLAPTRPGAPLPPGRTITAARRQLFADGLATGWDPVESWGVWAVTPHPALRLHVDPGSEPVRVTLGLRAPPAVARRQVDLRFGGGTGPVAARATLGQRDSAVTFVLPPGQGVPEVALTFDAGPTVTLPDVPRHFGIGLVSVRVDPAVAPCHPDRGCRAPPGRARLQRRGVAGIEPSDVDRSFRHDPNAPKQGPRP